MWKRICSLIITFGLFVVLAACGAETPKDEKKPPNANDLLESDEVSAFVGEWICLKKNSCNDKGIILSISQKQGKLNAIRDMESNTPSGSKITFSVDVPTENSFYSSDTRATYTLDGEVLIEAFDNEKTNYYTATGELSENICQFIFCSEKSGDLSYCELHDSENKRYESLTDSNKSTIGYYIKSRYEYYDSINSGYSGDKYSNTIMQEAADRYGITEEHAYIIWANYY